MKLLHVSDLHFTADDEANRPLIDRVQFIAANYPNHFIVITGDIIDGEGALMPGAQRPVPSGAQGAPVVIPSLLSSLPPTGGSLPPPHVDAFVTGLQKAHAALSLLPRGKVIVCSGNHDYGLWGNLYYDNLPQIFDEHLFRPLINRGAPTDGSFVSIKSLLLNELSLSAEKPLLYSLSDGAVSIALISLCTSVRDASLPDIPAIPAIAAPLVLVTTPWASGIVGGRQLTALQNGPLNPLLPTNIFPTIVMLHHHPWVHNFFTKLNDADQLLALLRNHADLVLFGHQHVEKRYTPQEVPGGGLRAGALAAGSSREKTDAWEITIDPPPFGSLQAVYSFAKRPIV